MGWTLQPERKEADAHRQAGDRGLCCLFGVRSRWRGSPGAMQYFFPQVTDRVRFLAWPPLSPASSHSAHWLPHVVLLESRWLPNALRVCHLQTAMSGLKVPFSHFNLAVPCPFHLCLFRSTQFFFTEGGGGVQKVGLRFHKNSRCAQMCVGPASNAALSCGLLNVVFFAIYVVMPPLHFYRISRLAKIKHSGRHTG